MRRVPTVTTLDLVAIDDVFEMGSGYVLNFSDHTFRHFFADLGIDIDTTIASKAKRLRAFLREAEPVQAARTLEALLEYRGVNSPLKKGPSASVVRAARARRRSEERAEPTFVGEHAPEDRNEALADAAADARREFFNGLLRTAMTRRSTS